MKFENKDIVYIWKFKSHIHSLNIVNCKRSTIGWEYDSTTAITVSNRTCQHWKDSSPHSHGFTALLGDQENFCRNPDQEPNGPWCYTTDPAKRWEYCNIPKCGKRERSFTFLNWYYLAVVHCTQLTSTISNVLFSLWWSVNEFIGEKSIRTLSLQKMNVWIWFHRCYPTP